MASWRVLGYVPDSDEEEELPTLPAIALNPQRDEAENDRSRVLHEAVGTDLELAPNHNVLQDPINIENNHSTASKLERVFSHGLQIVRDVRAAIPATALDNSQTDSSLSSPPSSRELSPTRAFDKDPRFDQPNNSTFLQLVDSIRQDETQFPPRRSLRERAPIQQHPYLLEDAHYRQQMKGSGVKPVGVPAVPKAPARVQSEEDSQQTTNFSVSQPEESFNSTLPASLSGTQTSGGNAYGNNDSDPDGHTFEDADDELPDFSDILRHRRNLTKQKANQSGKARLTVRVPPIKPSAAVKDVYDFPSDEDKATRGGVSRDNSFRVPPSPPHSSSIGPDDDDDSTALILRGESGDTAATPRLPLTPMLSSENGSRKRPRVIPSSSEASQSSEDDETREASPLTEEDDSQGIRAIKAKLRGKLPASHVTIEMRDRNRALKQTKRLSWSPTKSMDMPGVARVTTAKGRSNRILMANTYLGESESEGSEDSKISRTATHEVRDEPLSPRLVENDNDAMTMLETWMDEPEIDPMMPTNATSRSLSGRHKLRQKKITHGWGVSNHRSIADTKNAGLNVTRKMSVSRRQASSKKRRKTRQRSAVLEMNVLDAPGIRNIEKKDQPSFLKIAARQANRSSYRPRANPAEKFFLLATEQDTLEINDQLKEYKRVRKVAGRSVSATSITRPAMQISNAATTDEVPMRSHPTAKIFTRSPHTNDIEQLKQSTKTLLSRMLLREEKGLDRDRGDNGAQYVSLAGSDEPQGNIGNHRLPFTRHNRSGHGQLLSRLQRPRAAQLEGEFINVQARKNAAFQHTSSELDTLQPTQTQLPAAFDHPIVARGWMKSQRKLKKKKPQKSTLPTAKMSPEVSYGVTQDIDKTRMPDDIRGKASREQVDVYALPGEWTQQALSNLCILRTLPEFTTFRDSIIGSGALLATIERASDIYYDPLASTYTQTAVRAPTTLHTTLCGLCDAETSTLVMAVLQDIDHIINEVPIQSESWLTQSDDEKRDRCIESMQQLVQYMTDSVFFYDTESIVSFVLSSANWLQNFVKCFAQRSDFSEIKTTMVVRCLNWLMIYTLQLHTVAKARPLLQEKMLAIFESIMNLTFRLVLRPRNLVHCVERLQSYFDESIASNMGVFDSAFPEAESIVVAWHVCKALSSGSHAKRFYQQCLPSIASDQTAHIVDQLSLRVLTLCFVLPLTLVLPMGHTVRNPQDAEQTDGVCLNLLSSYLQHLTTHIPIAQAPASIGQLLEVMENVCLKLIQQWKWPAPHTIAVSFFKTYVWNSMLPFNTAPSQESVFADLRCITGFQAVADNDFFKFLTTVGTCIQRLCDPKSNGTDESIAPSASKIRGLVFSLIPNNARPHDARDELSAAQFLALKNHFALYLTLYRYAPDGCRPRIQQLENQVDLTLSHFMVCRLSIIAWETVATIDVQNTVSASETLTAVSGWMDTMLKQAAVRLQDHQQPDAIILLRELLSAIGTVIEKCNSESTAHALLGSDTFATISKLMIDNEMHYKNESVLIAGLKTMHAYMKLASTSHIKGTLIAEIQLVVKHLLQQTLSTEELGSNAFVWQLMAVWVATAQPMVRSFHKYWNDYVDPHSSLSIDFLSGLRNSYAVNEAKECFYSELIEADQQFFFLECRPIVFVTWIATLLLPIHLLRFEHILTNKILQHERESLMIKDLAMTLLKHDNKRELTIQDIADSRITILRHVIQNIYGQSSAPEDEWLAGGLDPSSLTRLLKTMTTTMKSAWLNLKGDPVAQNDYTTLIHAIINELETYPYPDFKIDPWFTDGIEFPRPEQTLDNIFKCRFGEEGGEIAKSSIVTFRHMLRRAADTGGQASLVKDLIRVFHCLDPLRVKRIKNGDKGFEYSIDLAKQAKFIQIVFPVYFERASHSIEPGVLGPILELLIYVCEHIHFRIDNIDPPHMVQFITALAANVYAVRKALEETQLKHPYAAMMLEFVRVATGSVFSLLDSGIHLDEVVFEQFSGNVLGIFAVVQFHLPEHKSVVDTTFAVHEVPEADVDDDTTVIRDNVVYDSWTDPPGEDRELVPENMSWTLHFDAEEPPLSTAERDLRDFTRRDLDGLRGAGWNSRLVQDKEEEMWAFVRMVKGMKLVGDYDEWEECDALGYE